MKKRNYLRSCVGIDVSNLIIDVAISAIDDQIVPHLLASTRFDNNPSGHIKLEEWIERKRIKDVGLQVVLEATGIYHERLAYHLVNDGYELAIVLPNRIKSYCNSTSIRSVTDKISAKQIAEFGLLKRPQNWQKPQPVVRNLKLLTREKNALLDERTAVNNQMHAYDKRFSEDKAAIIRSQNRIQMINDQLAEIEKEIKSILKKKENAWFNEKIQKICTAPGLGFNTVVSVVAETDAFSLFHSSRQLVCYSGYDIIFKESGTSVKKKTRISHRGNKYIRKALFFPALVAKQHDHNMSSFFERLYGRQQVKMQAYTAIQRKLLVLIYTLWKKDETYNPNFVWTGKAETGSGGNQLVRNNLSDWNGPREG